MATAITACSGEENLAPEADMPITVSATMPGDVWAVASRGAGETYTGWTLHYTNYQNEAATYEPNVTVNGTSATFTTGSDLVWAQIKDTEAADETFYLTCQDSEEATFYATTTAAHGAATIKFADDMKPVVAKFTVKFTLENNLGADAKDFAITFSAQGAAEYDAPTHGAKCPEGTTVVTSFAALTGTTDANSCIVTGSILLPEQEMGDELIVKYGSHNWTVDLSKVTVGNSTQTANQLKAGQHITLNIKASYTSLNAPSIEIEAFTQGGSYDLGGVAQQPSTNQ